MSRGRSRQLATGILINQLVVLTATIAVGFALFAYGERRVLADQYEHRAAGIAQTTAAMPEVISCLEVPTRCGSSIQPITERVRHSTGASYVVVIDRFGVRHSHPIPSEIGKKIEEPLPLVVSDGQAHMGPDNGITGFSARARVPVFDGSGHVIGEVSAGVRQSSVTSALWHELPAYAVWFALALLGGLLASWLLAARLKRRTFGLELEEIALLLQEREATLHGIREGVIAFDPHGSVTMVNDEARRLLRLEHAPLGGRLDDLVPGGRLHDVLSGETSGQDEVVLTDDFALTVNRMSVSLAGKPHGSVVTLRDRTEMSGLLRELDSVRSLTDALRAQQHEFSNRMHTVAGLLELGQTSEALAYLTELRASGDSLIEDLGERIGSPLIVGLLVGKAADASERGIELHVSEDTWLGDAPDRVQALTTIVGNLVDNAFDALAAAPPLQEPARVSVAILEDEEEIVVRVHDNGPGVPPGAHESIFLDGFTTKPAAGLMHRGLGLALVHRLVQRLGGTITVSQGPGARFVVRLPQAARHPDATITEGVHR
jgi:two-component system CitB family sensor kinase